MTNTERKGSRLLVLLECGDVFKQVILRPGQFKKVSDAVINDSMDPDENHIQSVQITLGEIEIDAEQFDEMDDIDYPKHYNK